MRRLAGGALYGFAGGAIALGAATLTGAIDKNEDSQRRAGIEACAASLPPEPTQNTKIPGPCSEFEFDNTETIRRVTVDGVMDETVTVEFNLPSSDNFSTYENETVSTDAQRSADNRRVRNIIVSGMVAIGALTGLAIPPRMREHPTKT